MKLFVVGWYILPSFWQHYGVLVVYGYSLRWRCFECWIGINALALVLYPINVWLHSKLYVPQRQTTRTNVLRPNYLMAYLCLPIGIHGFIISLHAFHHI